MQAQSKPKNNHSLDRSSKYVTGREGHSSDRSSKYVTGREGPLIYFTKSSFDKPSIDIKVEI